MTEARDGLIKFMLFNVATRCLLPSHREASSIQNVELQAAHLGEGDDAGKLDYVLGWYDRPDRLWVDYNGNVSRRTPSAPAYVPPAAAVEPPSAEDVRTEAARRLRIIYGARDRAHLERMITDDALLVLQGDEAAIVRRANVNAHSLASKTLRSRDPIPGDYCADRHWPHG